MKKSKASNQNNNEHGMSSPFVEAYEEKGQEKDGDINQYFYNEFTDTPFLHAYEDVESIDDLTPEEERFSKLLNGLKSREFDQEIYGLVSSLRDEFESVRSDEIKNLPSLSSSLNILEVKVEPLIIESENIVNEYIKILDDVDLSTISDKELNAVLDKVDEDEFDLPGYIPIYEDFKWRRKKRGRNLLNKIKNKAKKAINYAKDTVKGAFKDPIKTIKKVGRDAKNIAKRKIKQFLKKFKKILRKLFSHVIKVAAGLLPKKLQKVARVLSKKIKHEIEESNLKEHVFDNGIGYIQEEFDYSIASLLLSDEDVLQEEIIHEFLYDKNFVSPQEIDDFNFSIDNFVSSIIAISDEEVENEDIVEPIVEGFVSSIIKAVKVGYKLLGGRPKLINAITKILAKLITKYVGKKNSEALAKSITDVGLKIFNLEYNDEIKSVVSGEVIAATIEDTVQKISMLPDHILDNDDVISSFIVDSFEDAAASYFPPIFSEEVYENYPDLRESHRPSVWMNTKRKIVNNSSNGKVTFGKRRKYKKCTRVVTREITPEMMDLVKSWRGRSLRSILKKCNKVGQKRKFRKVKAHLYELEAGGWISDIIRNESTELNLSAIDEVSLEQFHPLTEEASAVLFDEPRLGRNTDSEFLVDPIHTASGQRFYFIEFIGNEQDELYQGGQTRQPCCTQHVTFDFLQNQIRLATFIDEDQAENISLMLRRGAGIGETVRPIRKIYKNGLERAFGSGAEHQIQIIHGRYFVNRNTGIILRLVPSFWIDQIKGLLLNWMDRELFRSLPEVKSQCITATNNPALGITISLTVIAPPFLMSLNKLLAGQPVTVTDKLNNRPGEIVLKIIPGNWHG